jgi:hypothetical protein
MAETLNIAQTGPGHDIHELYPAKHLADGQILPSTGSNLRLEEDPKIDDHSRKVAQALCEPAFDDHEKFATILQSWDPDAGEAIHQRGRKLFLPEVTAGVHRAYNPEILVSDDRFDDLTALFSQGDCF